ncbi:MAG: radical SAM family heme chaperone HemW [Clostridia bacterium]
MEDIGVYVHIPFCESKCFYCDFNSVACNKLQDEKALIKKYFDSLIKEIISAAEMLAAYNISTIYIGGGTPSYVSEKYIVEILNILKSMCGNTDIEIAIEVNPGTCVKNKLNAYKEAGINRISIGLQSGNDKTLKQIGRIHTYKEFEETVLEVKKAGIDNFSVDYIFGLPNQTEDIVEEEIKEIIKLNPKHISTYDLEVYENTKLDFLIKEKYLEVPSEDEVVDIRHRGEETLTKLGYNRYEISNYAKEGYESKHNLAYWNQKKYIGFGAGASSFYNGIRYTNVKNIKEYIEKIESNQTISVVDEQMDLLDMIREYAVLRLRLKEGIDLNIFKARFKKDFLDMFKTEVESLVEKGLLIHEKNNIFLSERGKDLANIVWQEFI